MTRTRLSLALAAAAILALAASRLWLLPAHLSSNANEGWNAFQAARAWGTGPLYPPPGALTANNYPPLSFYVVGGLGRLIGDPIVAGRILSLLSVLAVAGCIALTVRRFGAAGGVAPLVSAALFLGFNATEFRAYLAMNDPQWFGQAAMTAAIALLIPGRRDQAPAPGRVATAALLTVAGGLVKHNLVALPLAATLWLALHHRRAFALWAATGAAALLLAAVVLHQIYGPDVFLDVLTADRHASVSRMLRASVLPVLSLLPLALAATGLVSDRRGDPRCDLLLLALGLGLGLGVLQRSGQGVNVNAHFEALVAACMAAGAVLARREFEARRPWSAPSLALLLAPFLVLVVTGLRSEIKEVAGRSRAQAAWTAMQDRIAATPGPVACETLALCFWAGKDFELDVFLYGQRAASRGEASALQTALRRGRLRAVELDPPRPLKRGDVANPVGPLVLQRGKVAFVDADGRRLVIPAP